jgi:hypothetical protein
VRGAGPLAVDHFMKVVRRRDISRFHSYLIRAPNFVLPRGLILLANARIVAFFPVLKWHHQLSALKPNHADLQSQFCLIFSFLAVATCNALHKNKFMRRCSMQECVC